MKNFVKIFIVVILVSVISYQAQAIQTKDATDTLAAYAPFEDLIQITPSDVTTYDPPLRGCIVEVAGDLVMNPIKSSVNITLSVLKGQLVPLIMTQVLSTGTTATVACGR